MSYNTKNFPPIHSINLLSSGELKSLTFRRRETFQTERYTSTQLIPLPADRWDQIYLSLNYRFPQKVIRHAFSMPNNIVGVTSPQSFLQSVRIISS